jgi:hypothetical protein
LIDEWEKDESEYDKWEATASSFEKDIGQCYIRFGAAIFHWKNHVVNYHYQHQKRHQHRRYN